MGGWVGGWCFCVWLVITALVLKYNGGFNTMHTVVGFSSSSTSELL